MTTTFTEAMATDLDPSEMFELRTGMWIPRGAVMAILAFLDREGVTNVAPSPAGPDGVDRALHVLGQLDPQKVEAEALDRVPPGAGKASVTEAVIRLCIEAIGERA